MLWFLFTCLFGFFLGGEILAFFAIILLELSTEPRASCIQEKYCSRDPNIEVMILDSTG